MSEAFSYSDHSRNTYCIANTLERLLLRISLRKGQRVEGSFRSPVSVLVSKEPHVYGKRAL